MNNNQEKETPNKSIFFLSIKTKLLLGFSLVILILFTINISSFLITKSSINKFDNMIEIPLLINEIDSTTEIIQKALTHYYIIKNTDDIKKITEAFDLIDNDIKKLKKLIKDDQGIALLDGIQQLKETILANSNDTIKNIDEDNSEASNLVEQSKSLRENMLTNIQTILSTELSNNKIIKDKMTKANTLLGIVLILLITVFSILIFISSSFYTDRIINPLRNVSNMLKNISTGEGDLTQKLLVKSKDEIGMLSKHFNNFILSQIKIIMQIKNLASKTREIGDNLASSSEESTASLIQIRSNIEKMNTKTEFLNEEISKSNQLSNEVKKFIYDLIYLVNDQASAIDKSSLSIKEMLSSIKTLVKNSDEKYKKSLKMQDIAENGEKLMGQTIEIIKKIADSTKIIIDLLKVINNTANQTNLLAMNAAIEAAHAGDKGKGFTVVADEIRKLAEDTSKSSIEISKSLKELIKYMQISEESTEKTSIIFKEMVDGIKEVSSNMVETNNAINEISDKNSIINDSLSLVLKTTNDVKNAYSNIDNNILKINESLNNINSISTDTKNGMEEVTTNINELYLEAKLVSEAGTSNIENISELDSLINKFKIE